MSATFRHSQSVSADGSLYDLIEELTERLNGREPVQLEAAIAAHPEHAEQLRKVWPSLSLFADLRSVESRSALSFPPLTMTAEGSLTGVLGDFRLLREIGRGGMGVVYEAEQISLGRTVALKVLPFAGVLEERQLHRFRNEARAAAGLKHPHIVPVYAVGCERGVHYYAMEYIEGRTLANVIAELRGAGCHGYEVRDVAVSIDHQHDHPEDSVTVTPEKTRSDTTRLRSAVDSTASASPVAVTFRTIAEWIAQVADALDYAHSVGIVHRDVKPSNLLLDARGQVWIADFGLAQFETDAGLTMTGDVLGTLRYMSPEQALGQRGVVDQRADVYSLGATLYELLTHAPLWSSNNRGELLRHIEHDDPPPPRRLNTIIPAELETIVLKAIAKDPAARYATAKEFGDDLQRFLEDRPIRARRPTWTERLRKWSRRHRTLVRSLTAAAAISAVSLFLAGWLVTSERQRSEIERLARRADTVAAEVGRQNASLHEYVTRINLADRALRLGNLDEGRAHLDACAPHNGQTDLRGFEWRYLSGVAQPAFPEIGRHTVAAYCVRLSPDGRRLASCGGDGIRIWDEATGELLKSLTEHTGDVNRIGFSPDGKWLVSTSEDRTAIVWDTESWTVVKRLLFQGIAGGGEFTPDGRTLLTAELKTPTSPGENVIHQWDTETWAEQSVLRGHDAEISAGDVSADGQTIATGDKDGTVILWDMPSGRVRHRFGQPFARAVPDRAIRCMALAHRHRWLLTADWSSMFYLWNIDSGEQLHRVEGVFARVNCAQFSPDDSLLVTGSDRAQAWQLLPDGTYREIAAVDTGHRIWAVCFLGRGEVALADDGGHIVRWSSSHPSRRVRFHTQDIGTTAGVQVQAAVSPDGRWLATAGSILQVQDLQSGTPIKADAFVQTVDVVDFSPDGRFLVGGHAEAGKVSFWDTATWQAIRTSDCLKSQSLRFQFPFGVGPVLVAAPDTAPREWFNLRSGERAEVLLSAPAFWSPRSPHVLAITETGVELRHSGRVLWQDDVSGVQAAVFTPGGKHLAIATRDRTIQVRDADTGERQSVCVHSSGVVQELVFSPDGITLASHSEPNSLVTLFHVATGRELLTLPTGFQRISTLTFSPNGDSLFVAGIGPDGYGQVVQFSVGDAVVPSSSRP